MPKRESHKAGSELFIVDNSADDWKALRYLRDWCQLSKSVDIATGYFEIGAAFAPYCEIRFATTQNNKQVCIVEVENSKEPAFLKFQGKDEFFIRRGNATKSLNAAEQHDYTKQHF